MLKKILLAVCIGLFIAGCQPTAEKEDTVYIIPEPKEITLHEGGFFKFTNEVRLKGDSLFPVTAEFFKEFIRDGTAQMEFTDEGNQYITFLKDDTLNPEGYTLSIEPDEITISAATDRGAFYAIQSLRQLMPEGIEDGSFRDHELKIPCLIISDEPRFKYRGMHLDVGRHMFSVDFIKKYIDALALLKMNTFHWHLTEDQGWRIEIKKYPKLQEIAAYRDETLVGHYNDQPHQFDGKRYGGYYTQEEIKTIVAYAASRHITIIPEIEMPGHSQAAIAAYPELGCTGKKIAVAKKWGVFEEIYCPKEQTFQFLEDVLDEVMALFPSQYIHIGGDEAPKVRWENCKECQQLIKAEGLKDEHELQNYFITRIEKYLNSKGRQIIGWDEILEGGLAPNATVMSWRGTDGAIAAAKQHHDVVMTPTSHCYFDYYQSENDNEPLAIGGFLPLEKVYNFNPIPEALTAEEAKYVLGAQGNVWTEYMPTSAQVEYMVFPRILAMSEVVWSPETSKDYKHFIQRVEHFNHRLDALRMNYANHLYEVAGAVISDKTGVYYRLQTLTEGKSILYTTDGSEPGLNATTYTAPISIAERTTIKARVSDGKKLLGKTFSEDINIHKAVGAEISIDKEPHQSYQGSGATGLINGISGSDKRYGDKEWLGFWGEDLIIEINFETPTTISKLATRFHNGNGQWIYAPKSMATTVYHEDKAPTVVKQIKSNDLLVDVNFDLGAGEPFHNVHKLRIYIENYGVISEGKQGAGNKAWTFVDEIIVN